MKQLFYFLGFFLLILSCDSKNELSDLDREFEFVKVDSLVMDILDPVKIIDYHHEKEIYLAVKYPSFEGHYFVLDKQGEILAENFLSEGPDAFGMVLLRGGFVGDEILFVSEGNAYVFDLNLKQQRKYPYHQGVRFRLVHFNRDNLSTFKFPDGTLQALVNLNDGYLQPYPEDYYDTLKLVHLMDIKTGNVIKGGSYDEHSMFRSGKFFPFMDKPVYFSDPNSKYISMIAYGDSILYQLDPTEDFKISNRIKLDRQGHDKMIDLPMSQASYTTVREHRSDNYKLAGLFDEIVGCGEELLVGYQTGTDPSRVYDGEDEELRTQEKNSRKRYFYLIQEGKRVGKPILWTKPGQLLLNVGPKRYLQFADQAEIHDYEKDYQCYYIFELREKTPE